MPFQLAQIMRLYNRPLLAVLCPGQEHLGAILSHLRSHPGEQRDPTGMTGKAHMLLHELTHLSPVEGQSDGKPTKLRVSYRAI